MLEQIGVVQKVIRGRRNSLDNEIGYVVVRGLGELSRQQGRYSRRVLEVFGQL